MIDRVGKKSSTLTVKSWVYLDNVRVGAKIHTSEDLEYDRYLWEESSSEMLMGRKVETRKVLKDGDIVVSMPEFLMILCKKEFAFRCRNCVLNTKLTRVVDGRTMLNISEKDILPIGIERMDMVEWLSTRDNLYEEEPILNGYNYFTEGENSKIDIKADSFNTHSFGNHFIIEEE